MKKILSTFSVTLFIAVFCMAGLALADPKTDTMDLIKKGHDYIVANGIEKAVAAFQTDEFKKDNGALYLFAYNYEGVCIAQGENVAMVGKNFWNLKTPEGNFHIQKLVEISKSGGGWYEYRWLNPEKKLAEKVSYIMPIKGMDGFISCGYWK